VKRLYQLEANLFGKRYTESHQDSFVYIYYKKTFWSLFFRTHCICSAFSCVWL